MKFRYLFDINDDRPHWQAFDLAVWQIAAAVFLPERTDTQTLIDTFSRQHIQQSAQTDRRSPRRTFLRAEIDDPVVYGPTHRWQESDDEIRCMYCGVRGQKTATGIKLHPSVTDPVARRCDTSHADLFKDMKYRPLSSVSLATRVALLSDEYVDKTHAERRRSSY